MRIGELATLAGTSTRALRHYESLGLLTARRDHRGHRTYDENDLRMLRQIRTLQDFGFGLEETRPFVECLRAGFPSGDVCPASLATYRAKLAELDSIIDELTRVRQSVRERLSQAEATAADAPPGCAFAPPPAPPA
ncbi:MerR family transcriptional regulator [Streptomyces sp. 3MP-14]|uniref:MerR family transcriptional regulator n=1 Tax=Streptomyces mimosae TaxID=2586635 RepID=A0A5N6A8H1_9ACTN|nr:MULTISPECIES: MerR family transcriptional regulator [Streptomyces]KAB8164246.1 MerR family transcriptional regulator [Streptomyces mimosae]KAB8176523.1 MerR family transcriptional regulator [Streptomyces sp. 3MP-14]